MHKKLTKYAIEVMQAYLDGKQIETTEIGGWRQCDHPSWNWLDNDYRIKPDAEYLPYQTAAEVFEDAEKHNWAVVLNNGEKDLIRISRDCVSLVYGHECFYIPETFGKFAWKDGTPFGKKK